MNWLHEWVLAPFVGFGFMRRALYGSFLLCLSACPVGVFLTLRRMSLVGDAMSHAILPGAAFGFLLYGLDIACPIWNCACTQSRSAVVNFLCRAAHTSAGFYILARTYC